MKIIHRKGTVWENGASVTNGDVSSDNVITVSPDDLSQLEPTDPILPIEPDPNVITNDENGIPDPVLYQAMLSASYGNAKVFWRIDIPNKNIVA